MKKTLFSSVLYTMERRLPFHMSCYIFLLYFSQNEATPWARRRCQQIPNGYDCSDMDLGLIPDEIPDSVQNLQFSFNRLPTLYNFTFQRLKSLHSLDLTRCGIVFMYEDVFKHQPDMETLILIGNPLSFIAGTAFSGPLTLKFLSLAQSQIKSLSNIPINNLAYLEVLDLGGIDIRSLDGINSFHWPNMKSLQLDMNSIERITSTDLQSILNVPGMSISFKGNNVIEIEQGAFRSLKLSSLDFSGCLNKMNIFSLLQGLKGLTTNTLNLGLYETDSKVHIPSSALQTFCSISVSELDFQLHHFEDLNNSSFHCLEGLTKLDLTRAHLNSLPFNTSGLAKLSHLTLNENSFRDVCHINSRNFPKLTHLSLRGNSKKLNFGRRCLGSLGLLKELDLSQSLLNPTGSCCNAQLFGLGELKLLNLSYAAPMKMIWSSKPFNATPKLEHLDFSHSLYTLNDRSPFSNLHSLRSLNLSWSNTSLTNTHIFNGLMALQYLDLKGNTIEGGVFDWAELFKYTPLLESLILSSCQITAFEENVFKGLTHLREIDLSQNKLTKLVTSGFYSLGFLQLNFASNAIMIVDVGNVLHLGNGSSVDVSYNPLVCNCSNFEFINWVRENKVKVKHVMETTCNETGTRLIDVKLQCGFSVGLLAFVIILVAIIIAAAIFCLVRRFRNTSQYTQL